jgi:maltose alpha-D-glucosyltransferase/alpha-amylase
LFAYVRNQGDGWAHALNHLDRLSAELSAEAGADEQATSPLFMSQMETLGWRVGELHAVLAADTSDPAFQPEPVTANDRQEWARTLADEANLTFGMLERRSAELPDSARASARAVLDARQAILDYAKQLEHAEAGALRTRYHGDLHLGQVLLTANDFLITDFEGEPVRPIDERRRKGSPLRDVAGLLRSFDYARAVAIDRLVSLRPDLEGRIEQAFATWCECSSEAFLRGYQIGVGQARSVPLDEPDMRRLVHLFQTEKALYELRYELENRPLWVSVPAHGLLALLGQRPSTQG